MKILHITDLHYNDSFSYDSRKVIDTIIADCKDQHIEYVYFTGDLVQTGQHIDNFNKADELLFERLIKELGISKHRIFICGGNHDVYRGQELSDTTEALSKISSDDMLEAFINKQKGQSFVESLKNINNYRQFEQSFYQAHQTTEISNLFTTSKFEHNGVNVGLMTINTAWRAIDSKTDRGNLLFPISILKQGIESLKDTEFKIFLHHHPVSDFKDWNASEIEDLTSSNFHMSFSGHLHKRKLSTQLTSEGGIFSCSSSATLSLDGTINGYSIIDIDLSTFEGTVDFRSFNRSDSTILIQKNPTSFSIPTGQKKKEAIGLVKTIRKRYQEELERANELFIPYREDTTEGGFIELFTTPILKTKSSAQIAKSQHNIPNKEIEAIIDEFASFLIYGKDKAGKTCILYKFFLTYLLGYGLHKILPIFIDCNDYKYTNKTIDIVKIFSRYYEVNDRKAQELIGNSKVVILIDNYDPKVDHIKTALSNFHISFPNSKVIAVAEEKLADSFKLEDLGDFTHETLYIHEILRTEVRLLANKWPNLSNEKRETILEKIFQIFNQLNIPVNYWTVSLFISIFERNSDANFHNNFELIQLYIDGLLDRKALALDKSIKIDFEEYKAFLASLSYFLLHDRSGVGYTATYKELVDFTAQYRDKHRRFVIEVSDILALIQSKGIIRKTTDDNYTFRLNGVFEYFLALQMTIDKKFKQQIITDDHFYLAFKNELELYAGFERNDIEYLNAIFSKTKELFKEITETYAGTNIDVQLREKVTRIGTIERPLKELGKAVQQSLTFEQQDQILTDMQPIQNVTSEVKVKEYYEKIDKTSENLEKAIFILARVYRNLKIQNDTKTDEVLDYVIDNICFLGFKLLDDYQADPAQISATSSNSERGKFILKMISSFMPLLVQSFLYDAIAQNDLERIFREKIESLKSNAKNNQFRLFVLYLTLVDTDLPNNYSLLEEMNNTIEFPVLKNALLIKLHYYLMFKCHQNNKLEKYIQALIQDVNLQLNNKVDLGKLHSNLEKSKKIGRFYNKNR